MSLARGSWVRAGPTRARVTRRVSLGPNERVLQQKVPIPAKPNRLSVAIQRTKFATDRFRRWSAQRAATFFLAEKAALSLTAQEARSAVSHLRNKYLAPRLELVTSASTSPEPGNRPITLAGPSFDILFISLPWAWFVDPGRTRVVRAMASDRDTRVPAPMKTHGAIRLSRFHSPSCVRFFGPRVGLEALRPKASCERLDNAGSQSQPRLPEWLIIALCHRARRRWAGRAVAGEARVLSRVTLG